MSLSSTTGWRSSCTTWWTSSSGSRTLERRSLSTRLLIKIGSSCHHHLLDCHWHSLLLHGGRWRPSCWSHLRSRHCLAHQVDLVEDNHNDLSDDNELFAYCYVWPWFVQWSSTIRMTVEEVRVLEPLIIFSLAYLSYITAGMLSWSPIISLIGCGLVQVECHISSPQSSSFNVNPQPQAHYAFRNIDSKSLHTVKGIIEICSSTRSTIWSSWSIHYYNQGFSSYFFFFSQINLIITLPPFSDSVIFLYLGVAMVNFQMYQWDAAFIGVSFFLCLFVR